MKLEPVQQQELQAMELCMLSLAVVFYSLQVKAPLFYLLLKLAMLIHKIFIIGTYENISNTSQCKKINKIVLILVWKLMGVNNLTEFRDKVQFITLILLWQLFLTFSRRNCLAKNGYFTVKSFETGKSKVQQRKNKFLLPTYPVLPYYLKMYLNIYHRKSYNLKKVFSTLLFHCKGKQCRLAVFGILSNRQEQRYPVTFLYK